MKLKNLKAALVPHPKALLRFRLPDGDEIPAHFHITEVGHVSKRFIDCGGQLHDRKETCLLQAYVAEDYDHRLTAGTFVKILRLGNAVLPNDDMEVEVEYDCCVVAQYPVTNAEFTGSHVELQLGEKRTACLARERCGIDAGGERSPAPASCC